MEVVEADKAQVILVGAFLIAIGVLSALLILNDIGFSQTIATQSGGEEEFGPLEFTDATEDAVSEAMAGNVTTPSDASVEFEEYIQTYSREVNNALLQRGARTEVRTNTSKITTAWMVGQRQNGNFQNATGGDKWIMMENVGTEHIRARFGLNVSEMGDPSPDPFVLNATESGDFESLDTLNTLGAEGWNLTAKIEDTGTQNLTLEINEYEVTTGAIGRETSVTDSDSTTTDVTGNETVTVDLINQTVNGNSGDFPSGTSVDPEKADGFRFENGSDGFGTYDFRLNGTVPKTSFNNPAGDGGSGPCDHRDGPPCRSVDGTEKHIVGVVHEVEEDAVDIEYVSRSTLYTDTVGGMVLDAEDVNLEKVRNVDGAPYFDVTITGDNAPVREEFDDVNVTYEVENTGTVKDTQNITLEIPRGNVRADEPIPTLGDLFPGTVNSSKLKWDNNQGDNGSYTAYVVSDNTTDTTQISVDKFDGSDRDPSISEGPVGFVIPSWDLVTGAATEVSGR